MSLDKRIIVALAILFSALITLLAIHKHDSAYNGGLGLAEERFEQLVYGVPESLHVYTPAIAGGRFDPRYTCDGEDASPQVSVSGFPGNTEALALIMYDPDAPSGTFIHWLIVVDAGTGVGEAVTFHGGMGVEGANGFGYIGYGGPCPPPQDGAHRYFILVVALDSKPGLDQGFTLDELLKVVEGHVIAWGYAMGEYAR